METRFLTQNQIAYAPSVPAGHAAMITDGAIIPLSRRLDSDTYVAHGATTGATYLVVRTGSKIQYGWAVAVRIIPAVDTGDTIGTLSFDWASGFPGKVNRALYPQVG